MTREERLDWLCRLRSGLVWFDVPPKERPVFEQVLSEVIKSLEQESCEDAVSREQAMAIIYKIKENHTSDRENHPINYGTLCDINLQLVNLPPVTPTKCIATVKFSKEDIQELVNEKMKDIVVERKKGKWIIKDGKEQGYDIAGIKTWYIQIMCNKCGFIKTAIEGHTGQYNYCPNCGAEMEGEDV